MFDYDLNKIGSEPKRQAIQSRPAWTTPDTDKPETAYNLLIIATKISFDCPQFS